MNVVPLKFYSYMTWVEITARNNTLRAEHCAAPWPDQDSWSLWQALFPR